MTFHYRKFCYMLYFLRQADTEASHLQGWGLFPAPSSQCVECVLSLSQFTIITICRYVNRCLCISCRFCALRWTDIPSRIFPCLVPSACWNRLQTHCELVPTKREPSQKCSHYFLKVSKLAETILSVTLKGMLNSFVFIPKSTMKMVLQNAGQKKINQMNRI